MEKLRSICPDLIHLEAESVPVQMAVNLKERLTKGGQLEKYEGENSSISFSVRCFGRLNCPEAVKRAHWPIGRRII